MNDYSSQSDNPVDLCLADKVGLPSSCHTTDYNACHSSCLPGQGRSQMIFFVWFGEAAEIQGGNMLLTRELSDKKSAILRGPFKAPYPDTTPHNMSNDVCLQCKKADNRADKTFCSDECARAAAAGAPNFLKLPDNHVKYKDGSYTPFF
jgi:hypothetical protein